MTKRVAVGATVGIGHVGTKTPYEVMKLEEQFAAAIPVGHSSTRFIDAVCFDERLER
jgi:hypothetical protein